MMIMIINFSSSQLSPRLNNYFPYRWVRLERLLKSPSGRLFNLLFDRRLIGMTRQKKMRIYKVCHLKFLVKIHKDRERCFSSFHEHGIKKKKDGTDACHMSFVIDHAHRRVFVAQWRSIGARNPKVWGSIPHGNSEVFLCPTLVTRRKTPFSISLLKSNLPSLLFYLPYKKMPITRTNQRAVRSHIHAMFCFMVQRIFKTHFIQLV